MANIPSIKLIQQKPTKASEQPEALGVEEEKNNRRFDLLGHKTKEVKKERQLTLQQELFCKLYATDREFFGNGAMSYAEAYGLNKKKPGWFKAAAVCASQNLVKPNIIKRINEYLDTEGFTAENVDRQHLFLINQNADLKTKMAAIKEFNNLKKRTDNALVKISIEDLMEENLAKRKAALEETD